MIFFFLHFGNGEGKRISFGMGTIRGSRLCARVVDDALINEEKLTLAPVSNGIEQERRKFENLIRSLS
jgi:hypothetical protein